MADPAREPKRPEEMAPKQNAPVDHLGNVDLRHRILADRAHRARQAARQAKNDAAAPKQEAKPPADASANASADDPVAERTNALMSGDVNDKAAAREDTAADKARGEALYRELDTALEVESPPDIELERMATMLAEKWPALNALLPNDPRVTRLRDEIVSRRDSATEAILQSVDVTVDEIEAVDPNQPQAETTLAALQAKAAPFLESAQSASLPQISEIASRLDAAMQQKSLEIASRDTADVEAAAASAPLPQKEGAERTKGQREHLKILARQAALENEVIFDLFHLLSDDLRDMGIEKGMALAAKQQGVPEKGAEEFAKVATTGVKHIIEQLDVSVENVREHNLEQILLAIDNQDDAEIDAAFASWEQSTPALLDMLRSLDPLQMPRLIIQQVGIDAFTAAGKAAGGALDAMGAMGKKLLGTGVKEDDRGVVDAAPKSEHDEGEHDEGEPEGLDGVVEEHPRIEGVAKVTQDNFIEDGIEKTLLAIVGGKELEGVMAKVGKALPILLDKIRKMPELFAKIDELRAMNVDLGISRRELLPREPGA